MEKFVKKITGTRADLVAGVDISKVHGGYFSSNKNIKEFINLGIKPIEKYLPKKVLHLDYGGGQGHLGKGVKDYLISKGFKVKTIVVDANSEFLKQSKEKGLRGELCNVQDSKLKDVDLITMRAVIHYNNPENQQGIFNKVFSSLKKGGFLVHQMSSGSKENCELRSAIVNISSLGRAVGKEHYRWISEEQCIDMLKKAGFSENNVFDYAPSNSWGPEEQWDRFNKKKTIQAKEINNFEELKLLESRRKNYLREANKLIENYLKKFSNSNLGVIKKKDSFLINYTYPILVSRK